MNWTPTKSHSNEPKIIANLDLTHWNFKIARHSDEVVFLEKARHPFRSLQTMSNCSGLTVEIAANSGISFMNISLLLSLKCLCYIAFRGISLVHTFAPVNNNNARSTLFLIWMQAMPYQAAPRHAGSCLSSQFKASNVQTFNGGNVWLNFFNCRMAKSSTWKITTIVIISF